MEDTDIISFLEEGKQGTKELRAKFGKYPQRLMRLLTESGAVIRFKRNGLVFWKLAEDALEDKEEIKKAIEFDAEVNDALQWAVDNVGTEAEPMPSYTPHKPNPMPTAEETRLDEIEEIPNSTIKYSKKNAYIDGNLLIGEFENNGIRCTGSVVLPLKESIYEEGKKKHWWSRK